jgi:hypothetical protein
MPHHAPAPCSYAAYQAAAIAEMDAIRAEWRAADAQWALDHRMHLHALTGRVLTASEVPAAGSCRGCGSKRLVVSANAASPSERFPTGARRLNCADCGQPAVYVSARDLLAAA